MRVVSIVCLLLAALPAPAQPRTAPIPDSERTRWFRDSKFGIFVHWGAYSVIGRHETKSGSSLPPVQATRNVFTAA